MTRSRRNALITADANAIKEADDNAIKAIDDTNNQSVIVKTGKWALDFYHVKFPTVVFDSINARDLKTNEHLVSHVGFTVKVKYDTLPEEIELLREKEARFDENTLTLTLISDRDREPLRGQLSKQTVYALLRQAKEIEVIRAP
ncbi:MAG: hypothetical protein CBC65_001965 [Rhodothermaceae bacterium TMED105]|nr:MAG: hypothetical protein CBC65_001965 [Rhodothermaceae bacterium TMED105]